jgi:hypothetical protein
MSLPGHLLLFINIIPQPRRIFQRLLEVRVHKSEGTVTPTREDNHNVRYHKSER